MASVAGEMEICEDHLIFSHQGIFGFNRFFYFNDHFGLGIDFFDRWQHRGTGGLILAVAKTATVTCCGLDIDGVAEACHFFNSRGCH